MKKRTPAMLKLQARQALRGNYGICAGSLLLSGAVFFIICLAVEIPVVIGLTLSDFLDSIQGFVVSSIGVCLFSLVIGFLSALLLFGYIKLCLRICRGERGEIKDIFFAFSRHIGKFAGLTLFFSIVPVVLGIPVAIVRAAGMLMAHSPAFLLIFTILMSGAEACIMIVLCLNYGMAAFILVENPEKSLWKALKESRHMMKGSRWRLFVLGLTFLGVILLSYCSCGIGFLWVIPYMVCTVIFFYFDITGFAGEIHYM